MVLYGQGSWDQLKPRLMFIPGIAKTDNYFSVLPFSRPRGQETLSINQAGRQAMKNYFLGAHCVPSAEPHIYKLKKYKTQVLALQAHKIHLAGGGLVVGKTNSRETVIQWCEVLELIF